MRWWILLLAACGASGIAEAQQMPSVAPEDEAICVGGPQWQPNIAETARVLHDPVPQSLHRALTDRCAFMSITHLSTVLLSLHVGFGSEASSTDALLFIEQIHLPDLPHPGSYPDALRRAWAAAQGDLRRVLQVQQPPGVSYSAQYRARRSSRSIRRLDSLVNARGRYQYLTQFYLDAAEEYGSLSLLRKADDYIRALEESRAFLDSRENTPAAALTRSNQRSYRADAFRMRAAVLRAEITRNAVDVSAAADLLGSLEKPIYRRAADVAFSGGTNFCSISLGWRDAEEVAAACRADDHLQDRVTAYWVNRAALDLVSGSDEAQVEQSWTSAIRLLEGEIRGEGGRCCYQSPARDLLRLQLLRARVYGRLTRAPDVEEQHTREEARYEALRYYQMAERSIHPYEAPMRFRRVAEPWLALWSVTAASAQAGDEAESRHEPTASLRYASYLRHILENLDSISAGAQ